ncbi:rhomboid family protein [Verrucomicrobiota bacterium]
MNNIAHQKCFNHLRREAVAMCPECRKFFCRECVTEHNSKVICAPCLKKINLPKTKKRSFRVLGLIVRCAAGIMVLWLAFYYMGQILLTLPDSFHEGTLWKSLI